MNKPKIVALVGLVAIFFSMARGASPAAFVHPGLFHTAAQLDFARQQIAAKAEPWTSTGLALQKFTDDLTWQPHAKEDWDVYGTYSSNYLAADPVKAYSFAMEWAMSGDQRYADKAIEIINAWSSTLKTISNSHTEIQPQEAKVSCGWNGSHFANAAEILAYYKPNGVGSGWSKEDQQRCQKMLLIFYEVIKDFEPGYNGNYDAAMMDTMACIAVFNDDQAMFSRALDHFWGKYRYEETGNHVDHGNLKVYFLADSGQCQETGRDQVHVQEALGNYAGLCAVAWNQGVDLYSAYDNLLLKGFEYTAKYNLGNDVPFEAFHKVGWADAPDSGDPNKNDPVKHSRGLFLPVYVTAYQHYALLKKLPMPFTYQVITAKSLRVQSLKGPNRPYLPEGMCENSGINWGTLNLSADEAKAVMTAPGDSTDKNSPPK